MEFTWGWDIFKNFSMNLSKRKVILEGVNIFLENSVSLKGQLVCP